MRILNTIRSTQIQNTPSTRPSLLMDFRNAKKLGNKVVYTRNSIASYVNEHGMIDYVAANVPRFTHDPLTIESQGLLCEYQAINTITNSELFTFTGTTWTTTNTNIASNLNISPDGSFTASKIIPTLTNAIHTISVAKTVSNDYQTFSMYVKAEENSKIMFEFTNALNDTASVSYDLVAKTATVVSAGSTDYSNVSSSITEYYNGWFRLAIIAYKGTVNTTHNLNIYFLNSSGSTTFSGDNTSGLYIWGAQLESGSFITSYIPSSITFTSRATAATMVDEYGYITSIAANIPRYTYTPLNKNIQPKLMLEPAATNLLTYSEDFSQSVWATTECTVTTNVAVYSPGNVRNICKLVETTTAAQHKLIYSRTGSNETLTFSIFARCNGVERSDIYLRFSNATNYSGTIFSISKGTRTNMVNLGTDYTAPISSMTYYSAGWCRCTITVTKNSVNTTNNIEIGIYNASDTYAGTSTYGIYIWGAQLESGYTPTSYIATTGSQVTRAADIGSSSQATRISDAYTINDIDFVNQSEGTLFIESYTYAPYIGDTVAANRIFCTLNGDGGFYNNSLGFWAWSNPTYYHRLLINVRYNTVGNLGINGSVYADHILDSGTDFKAIISYDATTASGAINGSNVYNMINVKTPLIQSMVFGYMMYGTIKKIAYYPKKFDSNVHKTLTQLSV